MTGEQKTLIDSLMGRSKFGEIWVHDGKITRDQLEDALREQRRTCERLGEIFIARSYSLLPVQAAVASSMISIRDDAIGRVRCGLTSGDEVTLLLSFREE